MTCLILSGAYKEEVMSARRQNELVLGVNNVQVKIEDAATSGNLGTLSFLDIEGTRAIHTLSYLDIKCTRAIGTLS